MEDFYDVPVTGIMLENGSRISVHYGSTANNRAADAEEANRTAEENGLMLIEPRDFALIVCRQKEIRGLKNVRRRWCWRMITYGRGTRRAAKRRHIP